MYGKSFESKFEGSLVGAGFNVWAVWDYIITKTHFGVIELNPKLLAFTLAGTRKGAEDEVLAAIDFLCAPDAESRSKEMEGRRLVREGQFQYRVVNWEHYQAMKKAADRRDYNREAQVKHRAKLKAALENGEAAKKVRKREHAKDVRNHKAALAAAPPPVAAPSDAFDTTTP